MPYGSSFVGPAVLLVASCRNFRPGVYYVAIPRERIKGPEFEKDDRISRSCCPHYDRIAPLFFAADGGPPNGWLFGCVSCYLPPPDEPFQRRRREYSGTQAFCGVVILFARSLKEVVGLTPPRPAPDLVPDSYWRRRGLRIAAKTTKFRLS